MKRPALFFSVLLALIVLLSGHSPVASQPTDPPPQPADLILDEMETVYYGNLARRDNGVPPLRWNAEMTDAARWFSWDSVENRVDPYCGHMDTLGRWPSERVPLFGYLGSSGAENCFCGYVTPQYAIEGWMNSEGHRANLLDPNSREVGLGYYLRTSDGRGYVTQDFGHDPVYPPVIIEDEAIATPSTAVDLYIYDRREGGGFAGLGPATEMMVGNEPCFTGSTWEPYAAERSWNLDPGTGWRTVYVKTRDAIGRTTLVSDTIYLGASAPLDELGTHLASSATDQVTLYGLDGGGLPSVQFSQNWFADDTFSTFNLWWGNGERVNDPDALGGTAFRLRPGDGESFAWVWTTEFFHDVPLVAYFRLKVSDNSSSEEVARISVEGGDVVYGSEDGALSLNGTDFTSANTYQEFAIPFTFHTNPDDVFLFFNFWRSGEANVYVDGVTIFTEPQAITSPLTWNVPGGNYRGGGIWVRYTDGTGAFSPIEEANLYPPMLSVSPSALAFLVEAGGAAPEPRTLNVQQQCSSFTWDVTENASWLTTQTVGNAVQVSVDATGLLTGTYYATVTVEADAAVVGSPAEVPVVLRVVDHIYAVFLPLVVRGQ